MTRFIKASNLYYAICIMLIVLGCDYKKSPKSYVKNQNIANCSTCHESHLAKTDPHKELSCLNCHTKFIHLKNPQSLNHSELVLIPGNLSDAKLTCGVCHPRQERGVSHSHMATNAPMIRKNRRVWDEPHNKKFHVLELDSDILASDSYFAQLCANCHLNKPKTSTGPYIGYSKGGGCLACHLDTTSSDKHAIIGKVPSDQVCFNCHSRSGRISLSYRGLVELSESSTAKSQKLPDGRTVYQISPDVHYQAGLQCHDCHSGGEVMATNSTKASCLDCHDFPMNSENPFTGNLVKQNKNARSLHLKNGVIKKVPELKLQAGHDASHSRLSCAACHSTFTPTCFGCHIEYEANEQGFNHLTGRQENGRWQEYHGEARASLPILGWGEQGKIVPFTPGMKLTIDKSGFYKHRLTKQKEHSTNISRSSNPKKWNRINKKKMSSQNSWKSINSNHKISKNLFAPLSPHTIGKARNCLSCHLSSEALGYGQGEMLVEKGRWVYRNIYELEKTGPNKGVALDGWIKPGMQNLSNPDGYSFSSKEQNNILRVGRCIQEQLKINSFATSGFILEKCRKKKFKL